MSSLADLQRDFQRHVLSGDSRILQAVSETPDAPAGTRLAIYCDAYRLRLVDALASNFPRLQQLLGEPDFATIAQRYIEHSPSRFTSIRWFGDGLPAWLAQSHAAHPWLAELAHWEWAIATAFDAGEAIPIGVGALARIAPSDWPTLAFGFHPSVQQLRMKTNAPALFKAFSEESAPPEPLVLAREQVWLIWRQELKNQYRSLSDSEAAALATMQAGGTFEAMCDSLCEWIGAEEVPVQAAGMLKRWVVEGLVAYIRSG